MKKVRLAVIIAVLVLVVAAGSFYLGMRFVDRPIKSVGQAEEFNRSLPITREKAELNPESINYESLASALLSDYMNRYRSKKVSDIERLLSVGFDEFEYVSGDLNEFVVSALFLVYPEKVDDLGSSYWGMTEDDGSVRNLYWLLTLKKENDGGYTLTHIAPEKAPDKDPATDSGLLDYRIQNNRVELTFDSGIHWQAVPFPLADLLGGEISVDQSSLIPGSYLLTNERVAFVYPKGDSWSQQKVTFQVSKDQGKSWEESIIADDFVGLRFRKVDFVTADFGYAILSGGRTMSQEAHYIYLTNDGGQTWRKTRSAETTQLISDGSFVDTQTGFLSFGVLNPDTPTLYYTQNGGSTWDLAKINIPGMYLNIFVSAEAPFVEDDHLALLVNQGDNGDYEGGNVKGKFISKDNGKTWEFAQEYKPLEAED